MESIQNKELKGLVIFLTAVVLSAALMWLVLELSAGKPRVSVNPKPKASKNLASEKDSSEEKVPLIGENFETYQFSDPFKPLSPSQAPAENKSLSSATSATASGTASNTAAHISSEPQVSDITLTNGKEAATVKINGKTAVYFEGQKVGDYKIINISTSTKTVEFLKGDQIFNIPLTKS